MSTSEHSHPSCTITHPQVHPTGFVDPADPASGTKVCLACWPAGTEPGLGCRHGTAAPFSLCCTMCVTLGFQPAGLLTDSFGLVHCPVLQFLAPEKLRGVGGILLNAEGRRFVDELTTRDKVTQVSGPVGGALALGKAVAQKIIKSKDHGVVECPFACFIWLVCVVMELSALMSTQPRPSPLAPPSPSLQAIMQQHGRQAFLVLGAAAAQQFGPAMGFYVGKQLFVKHDSLAAAATAMGVPEATLAAEVQAYNAAAAASKDAFGKSVFPTTIDAAAPLHVARITPVVHYTMVGCGRWHVKPGACLAFGQAACVGGWGSSACPVTQC